MASKRQRGEGSSSTHSRSYDQTKFINADAADKYRAWINRTMILERGLEPDPVLDGEMAQMIAERGWVKLTEKPNDAIIPVVTEFYANLQERNFHAVYVREKSVSVVGSAINAYFNVANYVGDADQHATYTPQYETIIAELCKPGTKWDVKGRGAMTFPQSELSRYGKAWHAFICARLMPTTHFTHVTKERAVLLYCIVTGRRINVGAVIESSIKRTLMGGATTGGFPHPALITDLCAHAGVTWVAREPHLYPATTLDHSSIIRYKVWEGAAQHPRGKGFIIPQTEAAPEPQSPMPMRRLQRQIAANHRELLRENTRLAQRQDVINFNNIQFQATMVEMFQQLHPDAAPFNVPDPQLLPMFPPSESEDDSAENSDGIDHND